MRLRRRCECGILSRLGGDVALHIGAADLSWGDLQMIAVPALIVAAIGVVLWGRWHWRDWRMRRAIEKVSCFPITRLTHRCRCALPYHHRIFVYKSRDAVDVAIGAITLGHSLYKNNPTNTEPML